MALKLPHKLPAAHKNAAGVTSIPDVDTGGYDFMIGGHGFRLATDPNQPYSRGSEPTTVHRFDSSLEPGEQSLSELPWVKAQSSFHGGAGQLNLEQGFTAFQYQQEQVEHIRFDNSLGVNVWTPGQVTRLPDCHVLGLGSFLPTCMVTAAVSGVDYAILGGPAGLKQAAYTSGPDVAPTVTSIDLTGALFGGASNCTITSIASDGLNYYAIVQLTADGSAAGVRTYIVKGSLTSTAAPTAIYKSDATSIQFPGVLGWAKARLVAGLGQSFYELSTNPASPPVAISSLTAKYTYPVTSWLWSCICESPGAILAAGHAGGQAAIIEFTLDTSGGTPTLSGGDTIFTPPMGELINSMTNAVGSFLALGTTTGVRIGTFDTFTGTLKMNPVSVTTTSPVLTTVTRDRFIYGGYTNQQADGTTGLVGIDLSMVVDVGGRNAYAPDLRPPTSATTRQGAVECAGLLPNSLRLVYITPDGIMTEGNGPGSDGVAWLKTSRIRHDTEELKLFKLGRIHGSLDVATLTVTGLAPYGVSVPLGTFGFITDGDPGEFRLPSGLNRWIQLQFQLNGSACILNSYAVKSYPAPDRQRIIMLTANCFTNETDRFGLDVTDPETPRTRLQNIEDLEQSGAETRLVEFTNSGAVANLVMIDQIEFKSISRPNIDDDFGGYITFKLRKTET